MYMTNIVEDSYSFILERWDDIVLVLLFLFIGLIYIVLSDTKFNESNDSNLQTTKVVILEGMTNNSGKSVTGKSSNSIVDNVHTDICAKYEGNGQKQQEHCTKDLAESVCKLSSCCIFAHNKDKNNDKNKYECVAGNASGPLFQENDLGEDVNFDYWYYKNKCYGDSKLCKDLEEN